MADLQKTIEVLFTGDDKLSPTLRDVGGGINDFSSNLKSVSEPLANVAKGILTLEAAFSALVAGGMALAISKSGEFGDSFNEITTLFQAGSDDVAAFKDDIKEYASTSTASLEDINGAIYQAISAGSSYSDSLDLLSTAEKISVAGKADLTSSLQLLATTMNAYGAGVDESSRYSDAFFTIVKNGVTTIPLLTTSLSQVTSSAATADIPIETLGAAIAGLTAEGAPTSEAMTRLKGAIVALTAPTDATKAAAKAMGVEIGSAAIKSKGFEQVLREVYDATGGDIEQIKKIIPRIEGAAAVMVLGADQSGVFAKTLQEMADKAGATDEAFGKMANNLSLTNQTLANNVKLLLVGIGDNLVESYQGVGLSVIEIFQALTEEISSGTFDPIFDRIKELADNARVYLSDVAKAIPEALDNVNFSGLIESFDNLLESIGGIAGGFFDNVDLTTAEGLAEAIQMVIDAISALNNTTSGIIEGLTPFFNILGDLIRAYSDLGSEAQETVGIILGIATGITPVLGVLGTFGLAIQGGALAVGGLTKAVGFVAGEGLVGSLMALAPWLLAVAAAYEAWTLGGEFGLKLQQESEAYNGLINKISDFVGKITGAYDLEEDLASVTGGTTDEIMRQAEELNQLNGEFDRIGQVGALEIDFSVNRGDLDTAENKKILDFILEKAQAGATPTEIIAALKAEYKDTESYDLINFVAARIAADKIVKLDVIQTEEFGAAKLFLTDDQLIAKNVKVDAEFADQQASELVAFIMERAATGATPAQIFTEIQAKYGDTKTGELIDWVQLPEAIDKLIEFNYGPGGTLGADMLSFFKDVTGTPAEGKYNLDVIVPEEGTKILNFIQSNIAAGASPAEIKTAIRAAYADNPSKELLDFVQIDAVIDKQAKLAIQSKDASSQDLIDLIQNSAESTTIQAALSLGIKDDAQSKTVYDFIKQRVAAGDEPVEIITKLQSTFADIASENQFDFLTLKEDIEKLVKIKVPDGTDLKSDIDAAVHVDESGFVSYPAQFHVDKEKLLTDAEQAALAVQETLDNQGINLRVDIGGLDEAQQKLSDATNAMADASKIDFTNAGQHVTAYFDKATQTWISSMEHVGDAVPGTIQEPVKKEIDDVYAEALKSKETIESALKYRAEVDIAGFDAQTKQLEIKAGVLSEALKIKGEIDIANLENVGKTIDALATGMESAAGLIEKALDSLSGIKSDFGPFSKQMNAALESIESETRNREKLTDSLVEINKAQVEYLNAKTRSLEKGEALIQIDGGDLQYELEAFMWKILEKIQIRASENYDEFLLGLQGGG